MWAALTLGRFVNSIKGSRSIFVILFVLAGIFVSASPIAAQTTPPWYNSAWTYRNAVAVTNTSGASLANYQVNVLLTSGFAFGNAKSDGSDLRVTASDGVTLIPFWVEAWNAAGSSASVWVNIPTIATTGTTIYLYYGNAAAASASGGSTTFDFFDDFSGATLDTTKWTAYGGSWTIVTDTQPDGTSGRVLSVTTATRQILASSYTGTDYVLQAHGKQVSGRVWGVGVRVNTVAEFNNVFVRKYASVEPGLSVGGSTTQGGVALSAVTVNPATVIGGSTSQGTVTLNAAAPAGGAV